MDVFYQYHHFKTILWHFQTFDVYLPTIVISLASKKSGLDFIKNDHEIESFSKINCDYFDYFPFVKNCFLLVLETLIV